MCSNLKNIIQVYSWGDYGHDMSGAGSDIKHNSSKFNFH